MLMKKLCAALLVLAVVVVGCGGVEEDEDTAAVTESDAPADSLVAGLPVLLDLGSDSCVPCKAMAPILDEMRETFAGRMDVRFIDVRKDAEAARRYGVRIIPTQVFFDEEGKELFRHQGFYSREDMLAKWAELGYEFSEARAQS